MKRHLTYRGTDPGRRAHTRGGGGGDSVFSSGKHQYLTCHVEPTNFRLNLQFINILQTSPAGQNAILMLFFCTGYIHFFLKRLRNNS